MREFFVFNREPITVNLRKKRERLAQTPVSLVLHMHIPFSDSKASGSYLFMIFFTPHQYREATWRLKKWSEGQIPLSRGMCGTIKPYTCACSGLNIYGITPWMANQEKRGLQKALQTVSDKADHCRHKVRCDTAGESKETSRGRYRSGASAELHMQGTRQGWQQQTRPG